MRYDLTLLTDKYNMLKFNLILFAFLSFSASAFAQLKRSSIYIEAGGYREIYSLNYDHILSLSEKLGFAPRIGIAWGGDDRFLVPVEVNFLLGNQNVAKHFGEFGIGATLGSKKSIGSGGAMLIGQGQEEQGMSAVWTSRVGYRHQKPSGGFMYRFGLILSYQTNYSAGKIKPFGGISIGYNW